MPLKLTAADKTDVGKQREQNEDSVYKRIETASDGDRGLFIVADGMGGYQAGEVASRLAVETISKAINDVHFFQPIQDQTTIKLTLSATPVDPDATVKMTPINPTEQNELLQQTVKLPETPIA
ncbi:MAG TPA: protein phosphatase 2C domain-containing protein, partial [Ktedonobacteraceae bacterium]|nr:protein phosphatase 2C domain-containing protein [Ktedonobacteraceae bacterium]